LCAASIWNALRPPYFHQLVLWGGSAAVGTMVLGLVGGAWLASGGLTLLVFLCFVKYALVGDVVP